MSAADHVVLVAKALSHPLRIAILSDLNELGQRRSPKQLSDHTGEMLSTCAYHCRQLRDFGLIELVETRQVRGSTEHIYELTDDPVLYQTLSTMLAGLT